MSRTIKSAAELAGVSVRTLHHYDQIGLLKPARVTEAGYRLYGDADLERLQQILFFRELGFGLREIGAILDSPHFDRRRALTDHRRLLVEERHRLSLLIASVDRTIETMEGTGTMSEKEMFEGFDESKLAEYREEARARWGSEKVDESYQRASRFSKQDWQATQAESQAIERGVADGMSRGPADSAVQAWVGRWFRLINDRYYDCSLEVFGGLGDLYVSDERFKAHYEAVEPGLAEFMRAAMHEYCDRYAATG